MSIAETAELRLKQLDGGRFQALAARYVGLKYGIPSVHHSGRSFGSENTTVGTPDCFLAKPNGHYVYIECGKKSSKSATLSKLQEDVQHCLKFEANQPEAGTIDEIVCCYGYPRLTPGDLDSIKKLDGRVSLIGPEEIAEACVSKYPWLARDYLDIEIGSGAFLDVQAFIDKNHNDRFAPDLDQRLIGRDRELADVCEAIQRNQAILLSGPSGCGKTKLALEACQKLAATCKAEFYVVTPTRQDIHEDLIVFLPDNRLIYLLLDDANQLAGLSTVVDYALGKPNVKLVVTCRNYAKKPVADELKHLKEFNVIDLNPLQAEDFKRVLETEIGLRGAGSSGRIASIVKGNLRLAFLLAESGVGGENVTTMQELLEVVYKDKLNDMPVVEQQTIAIASILGPHKTEDNVQLDALLQRFGLAWEAYISSCRAFHNRELLDATPDFEAVSFEEQNLRDYFLYHSLVASSVIQLPNLWHMVDGRKLCLNSLNTILSTFHDEQTLRELERQLEKLLYTTHDDKEALRVIDTFGLLLGKAGFSSLCSIISSRAAASNEKISYSPFDFHKNYARGSFDCLELSALLPFLMTEEYSLTAVGLLFNLLKRVRLSDSDVMELFERRLCFGGFYMRGSSSMENEVLRRLESGGLSDDGSAEAVFTILFSRGMFSDTLDYTQALSMYQVGFGNYHRTYTEELVSLRSRCIRMLVRLYQGCDQWSCESRKVLLGYRHDLGGDTLLSKDTYGLILKHVCPALRFASLEECEEVQGFIKAAARAGVDAKDSMTKGLGAGKRFAMSMLESERFPDNEVLERLVCNAAKLSYQDWEELLGLLVPQNQHATHLYVVDGVLASALESNVLDASIKELIVRDVAASGVRLPRAIDVCAARYLACYGWPDGRARLIDKQPPHMTYWLVCFDRHAVNAGYIPTTDQLVESLEGYGEVLPFETVCEMERKAPGIFAPYVREIGKRANIVEATGWYYLPYSLDEMGNFMVGECSTPENWAALAELLCALSLSANQYPSTEVVGDIIKKAPTCLPEFFASIVRRDSYEVAEVPWADIFERVGIDFAMEAIGLTEKNASVGDGCELDACEMHQSCKRLVLDAFNVAESIGRGAEFDNWACERIVGVHDEMVDLVVDAVTALDYPHRFTLAIRIAHAGVDASLFGRVAFGFPFNGISWSGSEQPLIKKKLEYCKSIESKLLEDGLFEYLPSTYEAIRSVEISQRKAVVREFVDPYFRNAEQNQNG